MQIENQNSNHRLQAVHQKAGDDFTLLDIFLLILCIKVSTIAWVL